MADEHSTTTEAPSSEHHGGFPPFAKETFASQLFWLVICFAALYMMVSRRSCRGSARSWRSGAIASTAISPKPDA